MIQFCESRDRHGIWILELTDTEKRIVASATSPCRDIALIRVKNRFREVCHQESQLVPRRYSLHSNLEEIS